MGRRRSCREALPGLSNAFEFEGKAYHQFDLKEEKDKIDKDERNFAQDWSVLYEAVLDGTFPLPPGNDRHRVVKTLKREWENLRGFVNVVEEVTE